MGNKHWIVEDIIAAGKRALERATAFDNPLRLFVEELEGRPELVEVCPRGAQCSGTPKPPHEPFTCMSDDCPLKEMRIRRAKNAGAVALLLTRRCVKCGRRVGPGARTDIPGDGLPSDCQCDDPSLGTVAATKATQPKMPERLPENTPGGPRISANVSLWNEAVKCAEYWRDVAIDWKANAESFRTQLELQADELRETKQSFRKLQDRVADRDRQLEQVLDQRKELLIQRDEVLFLLRAVRSGTVADIEAAWNGLSDAWKEAARRN